MTVVKCGTAVVYIDGKLLNESFTVLSKGHLDIKTVREIFRQTR